ncbi:MAG: hypothetical protein ACI8QC_003137 [Planctomycetota bacterium]|jgi:hypothetical protein
MRSRSKRAVLLLILPLLAGQASAQEASRFELHFDSEAFAEGAEGGFQGEVFVAFSEDGEPREKMHGWFGAPPVMRFDLKDVTQGTRAVVGVDDASAWVPAEWEQTFEKTWRVQAVARVSRTGRQAGLSAGDVYSAVASIVYSPDSDGVVALHLNTLTAEPVFEETERLRRFDFVSPALSKFHGFDYSMHAGVLLPENYDAQRRYPVLYSVTGFGGSYHGITRWARNQAEDDPLRDCIVVVPDANNRYGHSVFCDSDSIGPWGHALVYELIPALEKEFGGAGAEQRYVTGVSSGGWSSLWLQVTYPTEFSGCWSHVPDPIDFHDFQQINLYAPLEGGSARNMFVDEEGQERGLARRNGKVMLTYGDFARREHVLNPGGQIRSFDGTFSPPNPDGTPRRVFDVETGEIDHEAAKAWRKYDISNTLLTRWKELRPTLAGKIHVYAGEVDTFYLEGAVERFQQLAGEAGMLDDMHIEVVPGMAHTRHTAGHDAMLKTIAERMFEKAKQ